MSPRIPNRTLTEADARGIAEQAAEEGVRRAFLSLGVDLTSPSAILEFQRDLAHARSVRQAGELIKKQSIVTAVGIITAAIIGAVWLAFRGGN